MRSCCPPFSTSVLQQSRMWRPVLTRKMARIVVGPTGIISDLARYSNLFIINLLFYLTASISFVIYQPALPHIIFLFLFPSLKSAECICLWTNSMKLAANNVGWDYNWGARKENNDCLQFVMEFKLVLNRSAPEAQWKESLDTEMIIRRELPGASEWEVERYTRQIGKIWEVFEVRNGGQSWRIAKSHDEIQSFIIDYNLRFKAKLVFGTFMMRGVREICENVPAREWPPFLGFFEWEQIEGGKVKSVRLLKKSGGRYKDYLCCRLPWQWNERQFLITELGVLYLSNSKEPKEFLPFGNSFRILKGKQQTGYEMGIMVEANHRKLLLYAQNPKDFFEFLYFARLTQNEALVHAEYRFKSFARVRKNKNNVRFIIDGEDYFKAVTEGIERAQSQLMITGWYISPEFQLMRPLSKYREKRLDLLLKSAADRNVKVFVLVYNESSFLHNDSAYVKETFQALSPNIKVVQHPLGVLPTFWSHHQKLVIIDQSEAFLGGLDLGFGRFDNSLHLINHNDPDYYPGIEYNNSRNKDIKDVREFWRDGVSRDAARLPWHDVGVHLQGEAVLDLAHHFIQYWNYASFQTHYQDRYVLVLERDKPKKTLLKQIRDDIANKFRGISQFAGELKRRIFSTRDAEEQPKPSQSEHGKGLRQEQIKITVQEGSSENRSNRRWKPRFEESWYESDSPVPMHSMQGEGRLWAKSQEGKLSQGSQDVIKEGEKKALQLRKQFASIKELDEIVEKMEDQIDNIDFMEELQFTRKRTQLLDIRQEAEGEFTCQILRSVGSWSIGCEPKNKEQSIYSAYLHLIRTARRFVYIENQFFISATQSTDTLQNQIAHELYSRIKAAVDHQEPFRVYVIIPLIPGFAGELDDADAVIPRVIMHWQYAAICRGDSSLMSRVLALGVDPADYIQFFGLRTHGIVADKPETEIVYVHSKLLVVDDERAIIGSANINERSMRGSRDSEVCVLIEDGPQRQVRGHSVSEEIHGLRMRLFQEHFGIDLDASDPADELVWKLIKQRASKNTSLYRQIFHCYPDDEISKLADLTTIRKNNGKDNRQLYEQKKDEIVGFAVEYPLYFLKEEDLMVGATLYPDALSV